MATVAVTAFLELHDPMVACAGRGGQSVSASRKSAHALRRRLCCELAVGPALCCNESANVALRSKISAAVVRKVSAETHATIFITLQYAKQEMEAINDCFLLGISVGSGSPSANSCGLAAAMLCI